MNLPCGNNHFEYFGVCISFIGNESQEWGLSPPTGFVVVPSQSLQFVVMQVPVKSWRKSMLIAKALLLLIKGSSLEDKYLF